MKIKTAELQGLALDWAVAAALGWRRIGAEDLARDLPPEGVYETVGWADNGRDRWDKILVGGKEWAPSRNWTQGGALIDDHQIAVSYDAEWEYDPEDPEDHGQRWFAQSPSQQHLVYGSTALEAVCRCFVLMKLGPTVELPKALSD